jgi:hypothetical protein
MPGSYILDYDGSLFTLQQFHFHAPSEWAFAPKCISVKNKENHFTAETQRKQERTLEFLCASLFFTPSYVDCLIIRLFFFPKSACNAPIDSFRCFAGLWSCALA